MGRDGVRISVSEVVFWAFFEISFVITLEPLVGLSLIHI